MFVFFQVSEKLGLLHVSQGEGKERHLMVSKPGGSAAGVSEMEATDGAIGEAGVLEPKNHASSAGKVWSFDMFCGVFLVSRGHYVVDRISRGHYLVDRTLKSKN